MPMLQWVKSKVTWFCEYETERIVHIRTLEGNTIRSKMLGVLHRIFQFLVIVYLVGWVTIYKKGYQGSDEAEYAVITKVKGALQTKFTDSELKNVPPQWRHLYSRLWDVADFVVPAEENEALFVMTNVVITPNQSRASCPDLQGTRQCSSHRHCQPGKLSTHSLGIQTGDCNQTTKTCTVSAWCPLETDKLPLGKDRAVLEDVQNLTVLIKNQIFFPNYNQARSNILQTQNDSYLKNCRYNKSHDTDQFCPVFNIGHMVRMSGQNISDIAVYGGVINVDISWDCNLDYDISHCRPEYSFSRLDDRKSKISPGLNYRRAEYYGENRRNFYKTYGIKFVVNVRGKAGQFHLKIFLLTVGAQCGFFGLVTLLYGFFLRPCLHPNNDHYKDTKYLIVTTEQESTDAD